MTTRKELVEALRGRYRSASYGDRIKILDEFVALTGYHRKHAIRVVAMVPDAYAGKAQLRTLQRRVKAWRSQRVKEMVLGNLNKSAAVPVEA